MTVGCSQWQLTFCCAVGILGAQYGCIIEILSSKSKFWMYGHEEMLCIMGGCGNLPDLPMTRRKTRLSLSNLCGHQHEAEVGASVWICLFCKFPQVIESGKLTHSIYIDVVL
jgi:hypothetical protein